MYGPQANEIHPLKGFDQVCFIKNTITNPNIVVGDYSYYDDPINSEDFESNVLYHYPFIGDKLIIGKFCAIARGVKFIMNGANHKMNCFTTYPFSIFRNGWEKATPKMSELPFKGDTVIGNDVWIGYNSLIMPGVHIGNGSIIASNSVVVNDIDPYSIVGGNPAKLIRKRFESDITNLLEDMRWWDWPIEKITEHLEVLTSNDINKLRKILDA
jgi:virginiamycin A acetyltransferase